MKIYFLKKEIEQIKAAIKARLEKTTNENQKLRLYELLFKINKQQLTLKKDEASLLKGIIDDFIFTPQKDKIIFFKSKSNLEFLKLTKSEEKEIENLDKIIILYNKISTEEPKIPTFKEILKPYTVLKNLFRNEFYFSLSGDEIYKIGIPVSENQTITLDIDSENEITKFQYVDNETFNPKETFEKLGTKEEVLAILSNYEKGHKLTKRQKFIKEILQ